MQSACRTPRADIIEFGLPADRQQVLRLSGPALPEEASTGYQDIRLAGQFLVESPVARIRDAAGNRMGLLPGDLQRDAPVQGTDEIAVHERSATGRGAFMEVFLQVQAMQRQ